MIPLERQSEYVMYKEIHKALILISSPATASFSQITHERNLRSQSPLSELTPFSPLFPVSSLTHQPNHHRWMIILSHHQDPQRAHLQMRNTLNLHIRLHWQLVHGHTRPARLEVSEPFLIFAVDGREIVHGSEEDADLDDVVHGGTGFGEDGREVGEALFLGKRCYEKRGSTRVMLKTRESHSTFLMFNISPWGFNGLIEPLILTSEQK